MVHLKEEEAGEVGDKEGKGENEAIHWLLMDKTHRK
jgi:hypothetical protein